MYGQATVLCSPRLPTTPRTTAVSLQQAEANGLEELVHGDCLRGGTGER
jgi:hypothetical protein